MGETESQSTSKHVDSFSEARSGGGGLTTLTDEGDHPDEPPLPSGSSALVRNDPVAGRPLAESPSDTLSVRNKAHTLSHLQVAQSLGTNIGTGLSSVDALARLQEYGHNYLQASGGTAWWRILLRQVSNMLTVVLVIAMALSYGTFDFIEGGVISAVIVLNIVVGFYQDFQADRTIESLKALTAPVCKVIRDGGVQSTVKSELLVVGDIVQLNVGDIIPADLRLCESVNLSMDEARFTGESEPCSKDANRLLDEIDVPIGDRVNTVYSSTTVTRGRGTGLVIATGMNTELGQIAKSAQGSGDVIGGSVPVRLYRYFIKGFKNTFGLVGTPLQVTLNMFAILLFGIAILLAVIVFSANKWQIDDDVAIYGICVAVAVIPESLIAVLTITMAVGGKAMAKGNVIVRQLKALEAVGGVTNICSDKTGTLTQGKMLAKKAYLPDGMRVNVQDEGTPFDPDTGGIFNGAQRLSKADVDENHNLSRLFMTISLCNLSTVYKVSHHATEKEASEDWKASGEPTEIALRVFSMRVRYDKSGLIEDDALVLVDEHPFDSAIKRMSVVYRDGVNGASYVFTKGATESLLPLLECPAKEKDAIRYQEEAMASEGLRVLCLGQRKLLDLESTPGTARGNVEQNLKFAGLVGIYDPPRPESAQAVRECQAAGISVHMLTGDHLKTASTIARAIGILNPHVPGASASTAVMTAPTFDQMLDSELDELETLPLVIARCSPTTKLRMLHALKRRGAYCVMTGDGVNDSPALRGADVGIAMGKNGSDVAKDVSDMVLTDDNFASIVSAIREGRRLFDNIQKVILLLIGLGFKDESNKSVFPLSPLEILWANLITSSPLAVGLGYEQASADVMIRPPRSLKKGIFTRGLIVDKFVYGTIMGALCLISFVIVVYAVGDGKLGVDCNHGYNDSCDVVFRARGTAYTILTFLLCVTAWEVKHFTRSLFNMNPENYSGPLSVFKTVWRNQLLFFAVVIGFATPFPILYLPVINRIVFRHKAIDWEWGLVFGSLIVYVALVEGWKALKRRYYRNDSVSKSEDSSIV